ncbi:2 4-dienoyl-CoA reductase NADPH [Paramagnetospirillum magnetotacticum MS-1]|uniref:2 4-dienoyl-CoA reductase NADPH n=1 Tax=Paramagnetospirillum magnetotacticum MS-1 TaxID=272627 RepID=A0A0C2Z195_PARME|nr:NADPH-dependent 2,4-dienoyl-CoA reductase [Paramagnetospirillum magnetotacticum]KIM00666.1 2 4-dienoyl-CoA reductase NADPH [Paramagnetospirillum magnetotacticum MS-1]
MPHRHLLSPITLRAIHLPNRMIMGSMHLGFEGLPDAWPRLAAFYAERARGGIGLIVTGGVAPNEQGNFGPDGTVLTSEAELPGHQLITQAVHREGGRIIMQILHCGRYSRMKDIVAPSAIRAPINSATPRELTDAEIVQTVADYANCARLALLAGYDGVEVMASEGYLINEFLAPRTNKRTDRWGGDLHGRMRFLVEIVRAVRQALGEAKMMSVRLSMVDLVEDGLSADEVVAVAQAIEIEGCDLINSGIGWHEARVPTIAHTVPQGVWSWATARVKAAVKIPVAASNRIKTPDLAESLIAEGQCDLVSMARPLLADPAFAAKVARGEASTINACIGCNQGCLDPIFSGGAATCLVNPRAGREGEFMARPPCETKRIAVVGGGPAGLACALEAAKRGHAVTLFDAAPQLGGQFILAQTVPGKEEYAATPAYYAQALTQAGVTLRLGRAAAASDLTGFERIVLATGIRPRKLDLPGADHPKVVGYEDILSGAKRAGARVAIMGAGGIGFDVALTLVGEDHEADFNAQWGIDRAFTHRGALAEPSAPPPPKRAITMLQRKPDRPGASLGKTTGWIHKAHLQRHHVDMLAGVTYRRIDDAGLHVTLNGEDRLIEADTIVVCIGQEPRRDLADELKALGRDVQLIGGARDASKLDALAAFEEGTRLGLAL